MATPLTFVNENPKQTRIVSYLSRKTCHSTYRWVKLFPLANPPTPASFHAEVDNKGWTVVVGLLADGSVMGGFTSVSWTSAANPIALSDPYAFLFSMQRNGTEVFFPATGAAQVMHNAAAGPTFGNNELYFALGAGSTCQALANFRVDAPTVNGPGVVADPSNPAVAWDPNTGSKQLMAVEVYQVVPADIPPISKPISVPDKINELGKLFKVLSDLRVNQLNICFVGDAKSGKSTTMNNLMCAFSDSKRLQTHAFATNLHDHGTTSYNTYHLNTLIDDVIDGFKDALPAIFLNDMPGFTDATSLNKIETLIPFIAQGRVTAGWKLSTNPAFLEHQQINQSDWIHLFVIIIPADAINNPAKMELYRRLEATIRAAPPGKDYPHYPNVVYLSTQMDDPARGGDILLKSQPTNVDASQTWEHYKQRMLAPQPTGLGHNNVFPIVNITQQDNAIPEANLVVFFEAWIRILRAIKANVLQWRS